MFTDCFRGDLTRGCEHRESSILGNMLEIKPAVLGMHTEGFATKSHPQPCYNQLYTNIVGTSTERIQVF